MPAPVAPAGALPAAWEPAALPPPGSPARMAAVAREFEALLLQQLVAGLRRTVDEAEPASQAMTLWRELLDVQVARAMAAAGGVGLAHLVEGALTRTHASGAAPAPDKGLVPPR